MPRVNWYLSPEAKAIFEAYKLAKRLSQDDAANAMIMEFNKMKCIEFHCDICKKCKGAGYI